MPKTQSETKRSTGFVNDKLNNCLYVLSVVVFLLVSVTGYFNLAINAIEALTSAELQQTLFQATFAIHLLTSLVFSLLIIFYIAGHVRRAKHHVNVKARYYGWLLSSSTAAVIITGFLLIRGISEWEIPNGVIRSFIYILHIGIPLLIAYYFYSHRQKARKRQLSRPFIWPTIFITLIPLFALHIYENVNESNEANTQYLPSMMKAKSNQHRTAQPEDFLDQDYCLSCHEDIHESWSLSAHRFSSFNNPFYKSSIMQLQEKLLSRDGNTQGARFCAGCHDPLILMSNGFDSSIEDDTHQYANAGLTCTFCHSISSIDSNRGNADFSVTPPAHYPFANSRNPTLSKFSDLLLRSNPEFHKQTFAKPVLRSTEFCGTCHKVHIPKFLNQYRWLRGQNHYDSFRLSGVSGTNVNSFFYPKKVIDNCQSCHMKEDPSSDPSAELSLYGERAAKNHQFASGNSAMAMLYPEKSSQIVSSHEKFLKNSVTVDIVGLRQGGQLDGQFIPSSENNTISVVAGQTYIAEVVIRTRTLGHLFTNGTTDSNQVWVALSLQSEFETLASSGILNRDGTLGQENTHVIKALLVDKNGNEIKKRNVEDVVASVFNNQIPPGASSVAHYRFTLPAEVGRKVSLQAAINYRKFDKQYLAFSLGSSNSIDLPIIELSSQVLQLEISDAHEVDESSRSEKQLQRLLDFGIGLYRKPNKSEFRQAEKILSQAYMAGSLQAGVNLLRLFYDEGRIDQAQTLLNELRVQQPYNSWTLDWYASKIAGDMGDINKKLNFLKKVVDEEYFTSDGSELKFSKDDKVILELAETHFSLAQLYADNEDRKLSELEASKSYYLAALKNDTENAQAHYGLWKTYKLLNDEHQAVQHQKLHQKYKLDEVAFSHAVAQARQKNTIWDKEASLYRVYTLE